MADQTKATEDRAPAAQTAAQTDPQTLATITALRRRLMNMKPPQQVEQLLAAMKRFESNAQLVGSVGGQ